MPFFKAAILPNLIAVAISFPSFLHLFLGGYLNSFSNIGLWLTGFSLAAVGLVVGHTMARFSK